MEREHYRIVKETGFNGGDGLAEHGGADRGHPRSKTEKPAFRELLLSRCVICGIALAVLLVLSMIDAPIVTNMRLGLRAAIAGQTTVSDVKDAFAGIGGAVQSAFGGSPSEEDALFLPSDAGSANGQNAPGDSANTTNAANDAGSGAPAAYVPTAENANNANNALNGGSRIDEDILKDLNAQ